MIINKKIKFLIFGIYSYLNNLIFLFLEIMPRSIRNFIFKILFKRFGKTVLIDYGTYFRYPSKIEIGNNVSINRGSKIFASKMVKNIKIIFKNNISVGPEVLFFSAGHDYNFLNLPDIAKSIIINDNVWIGGRSIILPGVEIGEGAVIGAGSVVTKNVAPYTIVTGNPARVIKSRIIIK